MTKTNANTYLSALTGVRALAAYLVYLHHYNPISKKEGNIFLFLNELHIGVTFFFVLSGFLIALRYSDKVELNKTWFKIYWLNRFARIYPIYFLLTTATYALQIVKDPINTDFLLMQYWRCISFLRGFSDTYKFIEISQAWSLTVEECFYLSAPFFFVWIAKNKHYLWIIPLILFAFGFFFTLFVENMDFPTYFWGNNNFFVGYTFFGRCFEFFVGIQLARLFLQRTEIKSKTYFTYLGVFMIFLSVVALAFLKVQSGADFGIRHPLGMLINNILLPIFGIAVFFWGLLTEKTWIRIILESKLLGILGKSSYIFYLIHLGFIYTFISYLIPDFSISGLRYVLVFLSVNLVAIVLFKFVEEPLNLWIRKKWKSE